MYIEDEHARHFLDTEKARLLKKYQCETIEEAIQILEAKVAEQKIAPPGGDTF